MALNLDYAETLALKEKFSIAVGTEQGSIQVFDLRALKVVQKYNKHTSRINCIQYQYKTPCLVSVSKDKQLNVNNNHKIINIFVWINYFVFKVYDTDEGRLLYSIDYFNEIKSMDISLDDQLLATTSFRSNNEVMNKLSLNPIIASIYYIFFRLLYGSLKP